MLAVDERSFNRERFWGPNTIKPLNFNYDFTPNFGGQNIWTLTDGLFVSDKRRYTFKLSEDLGGQEALKVIYSRDEDRKTPSARRKSSSRYRHFPTIDENIHQKSSPPARDSAKVKPSSSVSRKNSRNSRIVSSGGSLSSRVTPPLAPTGATGPRKPQQDPTGHHRDPQVFSLTKLDPRTDPKETLVSRRKSKDIPKGKSFPKTSPQGYQKTQEQKGVSVKLSLEETERLLKSLDFRVRTRKKNTTRERSKSERVRKSPFLKSKNSSPTTKMPFQKRGVVGSATKKERIGVKSPEKKEKMISRTSQNQLVRSSRKTSWQTSSTESSRNKSMSSTSGLGDLLGPLPRVKWTPESRTPKERTARKKPSEKSSVTLMKASKMKAVLRKAADRDSPPSQDLSEVEGSSQEAVVVRKVRTTPMKIIPKVTINNQLLKSTTTKNEKPQEKKVSPKTVAGKKRVASSTFWTPEKIELLDQITSDQQMKAVLMSAGDTYMKSRKYLGFKMNPRPVKAPPKAANASKTADMPKTADTSKTAAKPSVANVKSSGKLDPKTSSTVTVQPNESAQTGGAVDAEEKDDDKATGNAKKTTAPMKPLKPKTDYGVKLTKPTVVVKNKTTKMSTKTGAGAHLASGKNDASAGAKRRPKFVTTTKAKERLAQMTSEAAGPARIQSERMAQIRRTNLDTLKKILDKSLSAANKSIKPEEVTSATPN